ncbi:hypothetical protein HPB48_000239 [Haemaphysalis longicornis]|uniref:Kinesin motor domain-containing protein n=1 Tax=Haemaphysalis longicornis TaxID=44386 RepID=A0A9J6GSW8_HAELO|nr:hypothetical protein HPB48_000239 [Haemaphysalis longicornis]
MVAGGPRALPQLQAHPLLMDSLGGNSKTLMLPRISPARRNSGETINSLRFATKVSTREAAKRPRERHSTAHPAIPSEHSYWLLLCPLKQRNTSTVFAFWALIDPSPTVNQCHIGTARKNI